MTTEPEEKTCAIGDYVEIMTGDFRIGNLILHGIVLDIEKQPRLWRSYYIYVFETNQKGWYYSYELTTIRKGTLDNSLTKKALT